MEGGNRTGPGSAAAAAAGPRHGRRRRAGGYGDRQTATPAATASAPGVRRRSLSPRLRPHAVLTPPRPWRAAPRRPPPTTFLFSAWLLAATSASGSGSRRGHASARGNADGTAIAGASAAWRGEPRRAGGRSQAPPHAGPRRPRPLPSPRPTPACYVSTSLLGCALYSLAAPLRPTALESDSSGIKVLSGRHFV